MGIVADPLPWIRTYKHEKDDKPPIQTFFQLMGKSREGGRGSFKWSFNIILLNRTCLLKNRSSGFMKLWNFITRKSLLVPSLLQQLSTWSKFIKMYAHCTNVFTLKGIWSPQSHHPPYFEGDRTSSTPSTSVLWRGSDVLHPITLRTLKGIWRIFHTLRTLKMIWQPSPSVLWRKPDVSHHPLYVEEVICNV